MVGIRDAMSSAQNLSARFRLVLKLRSGSPLHVRTLSDGGFGAYIATRIAALNYLWFGFALPNRQLFAAGRVGHVSLIICLLFALRLYSTDLVYLLTGPIFPFRC